MAVNANPPVGLTLKYIYRLSMHILHKIHIEYNQRDMFGGFLLSRRPTTSSSASSKAFCCSALVASSIINIRS